MQVILNCAGQQVAFMSADTAAQLLVVLCNQEVPRGTTERYKDASLYGETLFPFLCERFGQIRPCRRAEYMNSSSLAYSACAKQ